MCRDPNPELGFRFGVSPAGGGPASGGYRHLITRLVVKNLVIHKTNLGINNQLSQKLVSVQFPFYQILDKLLYAFMRTAPIRRTESQSLCQP